MRTTRLPDRGRGPQRSPPGTLPTITGRPSLDTAPPPGRANARPSAAAWLELLTVAEAAAALKVSQRTVRRLIDADEIKIHRIGRAVRIAGTELRRYVAKSLR